MPISSSITRNTVTNLGTHFDLDLNIQAQSNYNLTRYEIFQNGIAQSNTNIVPARTEFASNAFFMQANTGYHDFEVVFHNANGDVQAANTRLYLDHTSPAINNFSVVGVTKNSSDDYVITLNAKCYDETGISKLEFIEGPNVTTEVSEVSTTEFETNHAKIVPGSFTGNKSFSLTAYDYSGNQVSAGPITIPLSSVPPNLQLPSVQQITQTATEYVIDLRIQSTLMPGQSIVAYSAVLDRPHPDWKPISATGFFVADVQIRVPISTPAGTKQIDVVVKDNYGNESITQSIPIQLDKIAPTGSIDVLKTEKVGTNYFTDLKLAATDAGKITAYAIAYNDPNSLSWTLVPNTTTFEKILSNVNIGSSGQTTVYVKYRDFSGNESALYTKSIVIDTVSPDAQFSFIRADKRSANGYDIHFETIAYDNEKISAIKFYGLNSNTANAVSGHDSQWQTIVPTIRIHEQKTLHMPLSEAEDSIDFYWQAKDLFGNVSPVRSYRFSFDKTNPVITSFAYEDVEQIDGNFRFYSKLLATDNVEIIEYRIGFDDLNLAPWQSIPPTNNLDLTCVLDFPGSAIGTTKTILAQIRDRFGNESTIESYDVTPDLDVPTGSAVFDNGQLTANNFVVNIAMTASDATSNVFWYSAVADNSELREWKPLPNTAPSISETLPVLVPRTDGGRHDFYVRYADKWKNESPVYHFEYDLDATTIIGGLELERVIKLSGVYTANVHFFAFDNKFVHEYEFFDGSSTTTTVLTPIQNHDEYRLIPLGLVPTNKNLTVRYKDGFGNYSDTYTLNVPLDGNAPTNELNYIGADSDSSYYYMNFDAPVADDSALRDFKFWYDGDGTPSTWTDFPIGTANTKLQRTFNVPIVDVNPTFTLRVRDIFENESSNSVTKTITTTPPTINSFVANNITFDMAGIHIDLDYDISADAGSTVSKLRVEVENGSLDDYDIDITNAANAIGTFSYTYPITYSSGSFRLSASSDYGYVSSPNTLPVVFDSVAPNITSVTHEGSFNDGTDIIVQVRVIADDATSGIRTMKFHDTVASTYYTFPVNLANNIDEVFNLRMPSGHPNTVDFTITATDLIGNVSSANTISGITLDYTPPAISNVIFNQGTTYDSVYEGANTAIVPFSFEASDLSKITHYKISSNNVEPFTIFWTPTAQTTSVAINTTIDLDNIDGFGYSNGLNTLFIHVRDFYNNIAVAGKQFEFDDIAPTISSSFLNYIERETISGIDHFRVPYTLNYTDNYGGAVQKDFWYQENGNTSPIFSTNFAANTAYSNTNFELVPVANYGNVVFQNKVIDRFEHESNVTQFDVDLEDIPPVINDFRINNDAAYTNSKDVFMKINASDNDRVFGFNFNAANNLVWNSTGWLNPPHGVAPVVDALYPVDLTAIGFSPGTCKVHAYSKDFCENVSMTDKSIIYDPDKPITTSFTVNSVNRTATTFDVELKAVVYDEISGLDKYIITRSAVDTNFVPVPAAPVIGDSVSTTTLTKVEQISSLENGLKHFYFQAIDAAGNYSVQANTSIYIDSVAPIGVYFYPQPDGRSSLYLNSSRNKFDFSVTDDYALSEIKYRIDYDSEIIFTSLPVVNEIKSQSGTIAFNFAGLSSGYHNAVLIVEDGLENRVEVPYRFYYDGTAPNIDLFEIIDIEPTTTAGEYKVEFNVRIFDDIVVEKYQIHVDGSLVAEVLTNTKDVLTTPTIIVSGIGPSTPKTFELKAYDSAGNESTSTITKTFTDGSNLNVTSFTAPTSVSSITSTDTFSVTANNTTSVNITHYAFTTADENSGKLYHNSAFWQNADAPGSIFSQTNTNLPISNFALIPNTAKDVYVYLKDECGNQVRDLKPITLGNTDSPPSISTFSPPTSIEKVGNYYVGDVSFDVQAQGTKMIVAYSISTDPNVNLFKSIVQQGSGTISQSFKIPTSELNGSTLLYIRTKDSDGIISPATRFTVNAEEMKLDRFDIEMNKYFAGTENVKVIYDTDHRGLEYQYAIAYNNSSVPASFTPTTATRNAVGEYEFNFTADSTGLSVGDEHELYVWLKDSSGQVESRKTTFVCESASTAPRARISILKHRVIGGRKYVWAEAIFEDDGVGVSEYKFEQTSGTLSSNFVSIPVSSYKRVVISQDFALTDTNTIDFQAICKDAAGTLSVLATLPFDLSNVV